MSQATKTVAITGASSGYGAALAREYAAPGVTLGLFGRDAERLEGVAEDCRKKGAQVETALFDVIEAKEVEAALGAFARAHPIDLIIANAGVFTGHGTNREMESLDEVVWLLRTNLEGVVNTIDAVLPTIRKRRSGRIAIVASLAALHPLADAPGYSASKAGVLNYAEALREYLMEDNVDVSIICPGHIETRQTEVQQGKLTLIVTPEYAASITRRSLDKGRTLIYFPRRMYWLVKAGRLVHWKLRAMLGKSERFHVAKPVETFNPVGK